jgi:hypothetical protein
MYEISLHHERLQRGTEDERGTDQHELDLHDAA